MHISIGMHGSQCLEKMPLKSFCAGGMLIVHGENPIKRIFLYEKNVPVCIIYFRYYYLSRKPTEILIIPDDSSQQFLLLLQKILCQETNSVGHMLQNWNYSEHEYAISSSAESVLHERQAKSLS